MKVHFCTKVLFQHDIPNSALTTDGSFYEADAFCIMKRRFLEVLSVVFPSLKKVMWNVLVKNDVHFSHIVAQKLFYIKQHEITG